MNWLFAWIQPSHLQRSGPTCCSLSLPILKRHDVALPWYKGHYYIHRPKVIEPLGESKTDFQIFTELSYRLEMLDPTVQGMGRRYNPRADRSYFLNPDAVDERYLTVWWNEKVMHHQHVDMSWETFKKHGIYKFKLARTHVAFQDQIEKGIPFPTPSGKDRNFFDQSCKYYRLETHPIRLRIPAIPKWMNPLSH